MNNLWLLLQTVLLMHLTGYNEIKLVMENATGKDKKIQIWRSWIKYVVRMMTNTG